MASFARSLVMDLYGDYLRYAQGGEVRLAGLLRVLEDFDIEPSSGRVTLSRLRNAGWFTARREGRETLYQLSEQMSEVLDEGRDRIFTRPEAPWDGQWTQVLYQVPESARGVRGSLRKRLSWMGFGQCAPSVWLSPHPMVEGAEQLRDEFPEAEIDVLRSATSGLASDIELAARCWDLEQVGRDYDGFIAACDSAVARAGVLRGQDALVERMRLVADARRMTFKDPRLPEELQPPHWPARRAFESFMQAHKALGPSAWMRIESRLGQVLDGNFIEHG
ncbi:PaaX family transcriptional regulator [Nesterenkonia sp. CF4.4]|uniref:PaaX family transcriptional regulator n=1 Tax=Nesterenkonia sp. CF4.4 TaxID=3373079 RepID=UPI003EE4BCA8